MPEPDGYSDPAKFIGYWPWYGEAGASWMKNTSGSSVRTRSYWAMIWAREGLMSTWLEEVRLLVGK